MIIEVNGKDYPVNVTYKNNKNMYLRIKDDLSINVTAPHRMPEVRIIKFINENLEYIEKVIIKKQQVKDKKEGKFEYLGNLYDICYTNKREVEFGSAKVFIGRSLNIDNWYKKEAKEIFTRVYNGCYANFRTRKKRPELKIRKMKSRAISN